MSGDIVEENNIERKAVNIKWLKSNFPCMHACPVETEAGRYVALIAEGKYQEAYDVARRPNPLASVCGRICAAPCESQCRKGQITTPDGLFEGPISIRALKRFVCERYGVESYHYEPPKFIKKRLASRVWKSERVAIVGSGPAGLSCAHDLALLGYHTTIFEAAPQAGGMLRLGVPEYRLPRQVLDREIEEILKLGVELKLNTPLTPVFGIRELKAAGFQAVFLAVGCQKSRDLAIEGADQDGVLKAIDFLLNVNLNYRVEIGEKVIVIGGGNVAFDVARSAWRKKQRGEATDMHEALDAARLAVRRGAKEITIIALERADEMLADEREIAEAREEGIVIINSEGPKRIVGSGGKATGLETMQVKTIFDETGRFNPTFYEEKVKTYAADTVILAIGQAPHLSFVRPEDGVELTPRGFMKIHPDTLATTSPGVFAGGDIAFGPRNVIDAIRDGRVAARSIHERLSSAVAPAEEEIVIRVLDQHTMWRDYDALPRQPVPILPLERRIGITEVELGYTPHLAHCEGRRCLQCWINPTFDGTEVDGSLCVLCGGCVDICPEDCFELVPLSLLEITEAVRRPLEERFAETLTTSLEAEAGGSALLMEGTRCIRCGLCVQRCPVNYITMESWEVIHSP